jgi:hypothetical protein
MGDSYFSGELEELDAVCLLMKGGYEDHYDPIVTLDVGEDDVAINNGYYHTYRIALDGINKIITYKRKRQYHQDIDVVGYTDYGHETIWENKQ